MRIHDVEFVEIKSNKIPKDCELTVYCRVYNHKEYIEDALQGFVNQTTNFNYKVLLIDDASNDGTNDILIDYQSKYPEIFHLIIACNNFYANPKKMYILNEIKKKFVDGKYIAFCEGDDYWIDDNKLQKQYDYLELNTDCTLYLHNAIVEDCNIDSEYIMLRDIETGILKMQDIILQPNGIYPTASMVMRKEISILDDFWAECGVGDWPIQLKAACQGYVYYSSECMSVYRYMHSSSWSCKIYSNLQSRYIHFSKISYLLNRVNKFTNYKYSEEIYVKIMSFYQCLLTEIPNVEEAIVLFRECNRIVDEKYSWFLREYIRDYDNHKSDCFFDECLKNYLNINKKIYVMGTGKYSCKLIHEIENKKFSIEGYVVSNNQEIMGLHKGLDVIHMSDLSDRKEEYGVIVGIYTDFNNRYEIEKSLLDNGVYNHFFPFDINIESFYK